jgi:predicted short-subunit dehydrogenase-like oxidoreductase (DUF2520 family)
MTAFLHDIVLVGSGNVATRLGLAIHEAGYRISQVYSRNKKTGKTLAEKLEAEFCSTISRLKTDASLTIIAISDDALPEFSDLFRSDGLVVHTSGSTGLKALSKCSDSYGVLYPLQTLSANTEIDFTSVPLCVEANNKKNLENLTYFARSISRNVRTVDSKQRAALHLAAVFACNFSNHMFSISDEILKEKGLKLELLLPLINETLRKIIHQSPSSAQTGPARRGDQKTIKKHLSMLSDPDLKKIYRVISDDIQKGR